MSDLDRGELLREEPSDAIDTWSRNAFEACADWPHAQAGPWFQSNDGYLRLRIEKVDGETLEPLSVLELDTSDGRILLDFGSWAI